MINGRSEKNHKMENENIKDKGYIWLPYITVVIKTMINGETTWYKNRWKNLLMKIKHFFIKPKYLKNMEKYNKKINAKNYNTINITPNENKK